MQRIIARKQEIIALRKAYNSKEAQFIAIYGRRRIGKTFLVRSLFATEKNYFELTGLKEAKLKDQLQNFIDGFSEKFFKGLALKTPNTWRDAFNLLTKELKKIPPSEKIILFFDELPWLASKRSQFMTYLDHFWNTQWSLMPNLLFIVCGSAASWMLDELINAKGGLHNRLTRTILLAPFTLKETEDFLKSRAIHLNRKQILDLYMSMGGIPHYLKEVEKGKSASENIGRICFTKDGLLFNEFPTLFRSLFEAAEVNLRLIRAIAENRFGISRTDLIKKVNLSTGGTFNKRIEELEAAGFIQSFVPYGKKVKDHYYRIIDEYSLFYLKWIEPLTKRGHQVEGQSYWINKSQSPSYMSWAGYAYESICMKHVLQIKKALDLSRVSCETGSWRFIPKQKTTEQGTQIDLLFDREDGAITLCEIKFTREEFKIDKSYAKALANKIEVFEQNFKTNKQVFLIMITTYGVKNTIWSEDLIHKQVTLDDLF